MLIEFTLKTRLMSFKAEAITIIPAFLVFLLAIYLAIFSFITVDPSQKQQCTSLAVALFYGGVFMAICWTIIWAMQKTPIMRHDDS